jgi:hypothetical protein
LRLYEKQIKLSVEQMVVLDVLYVAFATIAVMVFLQLVTFFVTRMMYPPEPKIIYRDVPVVQRQVQFAPPPVQEPPPLFPQNGPTLTQTQQEVQLPEYEPRKPASDSLRVDPELPIGLKETRPEGL